VLLHRLGSGSGAVSTTSAALVYGCCDFNGEISGSAPDLSKIMRRSWLFVSRAGSQLALVELHRLIVLPPSLFVVEALAGGNGGRVLQGPEPEMPYLLMVGQPRPEVVTEAALRAQPAAAASRLAQA